MDISSNTKMTYEELNELLGNKEEMYATLSQRFYLPKATSKAATKPYLTKVFLKSQNILKVPLNIPRSFVEYMGTDIKEMHQKLEKYLKDNNLPKTGMDAEHLPDYDWIYNVCCWLDPENTMGIAKQPNATLQNYEVEVDEE